MFQSFLIQTAHLSRLAPRENPVRNTPLFWVVSVMVIYSRNDVDVGIYSNFAITDPLRTDKRLNSLNV